MSQSLAQVYVHFVFSTKERRPFLKDKEFRERTHAFLAGICSDLDCPCLVVGGVEDHVHILCRLSRTHSISETVKELKRRSSLRIKDESSHVAAVIRYIQHQEEHHGTESYQDEFRRLLDKYGIEYDERYVWD
jgi:REP-associated tyrosine transposase